jgi:hypothetical protein
MGAKRTAVLNRTSTKLAVTWIAMMTFEGGSKMAV